KGRVALEPFVVLRQDAVDLRLLQHDLGDEDLVGVPCLSPRQIAPISAVPSQQPSPEPLSLLGSRGQKSSGKCWIKNVSGAVSADILDPKHSRNPLTKLYTKTGDTGETGLFDGTRVAKSDPRVEAYGAVDELEAWLGLVRSHHVDEDLEKMLSRIQ